MTQHDHKEHIREHWSTLNQLEPPVRTAWANLATYTTHLENDAQALAAASEHEPDLKPAAGALHAATGEILHTICTKLNKLNQKGTPT